MQIDIGKVWQEHSDAFFEDGLGVTAIEDYQIDILKDIQTYERIAIRACHSVGKTWLMARVALWFYSCFENSIVITTAPTFKQVDKLLWGELRSAYNNSRVPLGGVLLNTHLKRDDKWYAMGFSPQKKAGESSEQQGSSFQGFHSDYVLIIFDEATGVPPDIWRQAEGLMTSGTMVKWVCIANPTTSNCEFANCFKDPAWFKVKWSCYNSPNMIANKFTDREKIEDEMDYLSTLKDEQRLAHISNYLKPVPYLLTAQWAMSSLYKWGLDHPLSMSKILGEFPLEDDTVLIQLTYIEAAQAREIKVIDTDRRSIGVDVARFGADKTVLTEFKGPKHIDVLSIEKRDTMYVTGMVTNMINEGSDNCIVAIDATGIGSGVVDALVENQKNGLISKKVELVEVHFGASPVSKLDQDRAKRSKTQRDKNEQEKARYSILKSKMFDLLATDLKNTISLLNEAVYAEELPTIQHKFDSKGRIVIESKADYKTRTGRNSPDFSDSLALANYARNLDGAYGSFKNRVTEKPIMKQTKKRERSSRIKIKEY